MEYKNREEITSLVHATFAHLGYPELSKIIRIEFNKRFSSRMGDANYYNRLIRLSSSRLWDVATVKQRHDTIVHEACHIVQRHIYGYKVSHHGKEWKNLMVKCGLKPERCHRVNTLGINRTKAYCKCQHHIITKAMAKKIIKGEVRICRKCSSKLMVYCST